jgi:4a-hydroxytetrahydrobiopterin dehydratase
MEKYSDEILKGKLESLPGWQLKEGKLYRHFIFNNFREAFAFMTQVALLAEKSDHHPDWTNVYNNVEVCLYTHSASGITEKDFRLAAEISRLIPD